MAQITITVEDVPSGAEGKVVKLIKFVGQLDESNVDDKAKDIYAIIDSVPSGLKMVLDFSELEYMNSKSIGYLTDWYTKLSERSGGIVIASARPNILDILQVVGLTQLIPCVDTVDAAKVEATK